MSERQISGIELCQRLRNKIDRHPCGCETRWDEALWRSIDVGRCEYHQETVAALSAHLAPPGPARAGDTSGDAKGCGWCGLGAGHTTDEHLARWGNPDTTAAPVSGVAARAKGDGL